VHRSICESYHLIVRHVGSGHLPVTNVVVSAQGGYIAEGDVSPKEPEREKAEAILAQSPAPGLVESLSMSRQVRRSSGQGEDGDLARPGKDVWLLAAPCPARSDAGARPQAGRGKPLMTSEVEQDIYIIRRAVYDMWVRLRADLALWARRCVPLGGPWFGSAQPRYHEDARW